MRELTNEETSELKKLDEQIDVERLKWKRLSIDPGMVGIDFFDLCIKVDTMIDIFRFEFGCPEDMINLYYRRNLLHQLVRMRDQAEKQMAIQKQQADIAIPNGKIILGPDGSPMSL